MVKVKALKDERKKVKKLLRKHYGGVHTQNLIHKLAESGVVVGKQDVYNYFSYGTGEHGSKILEASYLLIEDAVNEAKMRAERLNNLSSPQKTSILP